MLLDKVFLIAAAAAVANADFDTYPPVPKTASINGFADPIYSNLPPCAQACVKKDTGITPCPYWDTGCLCVMSNWGNLVADCIASSCQGNAVVTATSLAQSICSSAGAGSWWLAATEVSLLEAAATATLTTSDSISSAQSEATNEAVSSTISAATSEQSSLITSAPASDKISTSAPVSDENPTITSEASSSSTTTKKAHTASINGFADPIYSELPSCAQPCVEEDTGITPCPYWDTGCLCVMSNWGNKVADCVASSCTGNDVASMTSLAQSMCSSAGAGKWYLAASESSLLESAASATATSSAEVSGHSSSDIYSASATATSSSEVSEHSSSGISAGTTSAASNSAINSNSVTSSSQSSSIGSSKSSSISYTSSSSVIDSSSVTSFKPSSVISTSPTASAKVGNCKINGITVDTVDIATGVCSFKLPASLPAQFDYVSSTDYVAEFYYAEINGDKFFTNITEEGLIINIAASLIFSIESGVDVLQVIAESSSQRKRASEAEIQEFVSYLETISGTPLPCGGIIISVDDDVSTEVTTADYQCSSTSGISKSTGLPTMYPSYTVNATTVEEFTKTITVTSCSDNKCSVATVPATPTLTTETKNGETTVYTTYCPISEIRTETELATTIITITSCSENKCSETTVPATPTLTTETKNGETTIYTTYCTISETTKTHETTSTTNVPENTDTIAVSRSSSATPTTTAIATVSIADSGASLMGSCYAFVYTFVALIPFLI